MSQIEPIPRFKIVLKELSDTEIFASQGRLFHSDAPIPLAKHLLLKSFFGKGILSRSKFTLSQGQSQSLEDPYYSVSSAYSDMFSIQVKDTKLCCLKFGRSHL